MDSRASGAALTSRVGSEAESFSGDRKEMDSHPDYRGFVNVGGREYWLSAWVKTGREGSKFDGQKFFSLSLQEKEERGGRSRNHDDQSRNDGGR